MRSLIAATLCLALSTAAQAQGWAYFKTHIFPSHRCNGAREVAASYYEARQGQRTSSGQGYDRSAYRAASSLRDGFSQGSVLHVSNPRNGRAVVIRVNDTLPMGAAFHAGVRLDLTPAAHRALGLHATEWVCVR